MAKNDFLKELLAKKKERIAAAKLALPLEVLREQQAQVPAARPFREAISKPRQIFLIAEIKKASPSAGVIRQEFDHIAIAKSYSEAGVQAISVLTEDDYFQGSVNHLLEVRRAVDLPLLRKDFIIDTYQVHEARACGADCVLLIADILTKDAISELTACAASLGMECLVEVHTEKELKKVLGMKVPMIGINNRDLHTLEVDFKTTEKLFPLIPKEKTIVVESGIQKYQDVLFLKILGVNAVLIGGAFMSAGDIKAKVEEVMGW